MVRYIIYYYHRKVKAVSQKMHLKTKKIVMAALMASMTCVATMIIKIPSPMQGYMNLGDCIVLLCGWMLAPGYAFFAAGIGSALADIFSGYVIYAPATFVIKPTKEITVISFAILDSIKKSTNKMSHTIYAEADAKWLFRILNKGIAEMRMSMSDMPEIIVAGPLFIHSGK